MPIRPVVPRNEALRRAIAWLAGHGTWSAETIGEASLRFDLSPADQEFLLQEFRRLRTRDVPPAGEE
ncbi:MAG: hypothetical protein HY017_22950 [Betaproteobacteria bacterium]|nr:hypothetical protein [Betaproteobacteria bacterium]